MIEYVIKAGFNPNFRFKFQIERWWSDVGGLVWWCQIKLLSMTVKSLNSNQNTL